MSGKSDVSKPKVVRNFLSVSVDALDDATLGMDLYIKHEHQSDPTLYRSIGVEFNSEDRGRLVEQGTTTLYVPMSQHAAYRRVLSDHIANAFNDSSMPDEQRAAMVRAASAQMIADSLASPTNSGLIAGTTDLGNQFTDMAMSDPERFGALLNVSEHDFYTAMHMLNVGVGCGMLYRELRPNDHETLPVILQGGFIHDIGKRGISEEILNKEGKLDPEEWEMIRSHPQLGYDELAAAGDVPDIILDMTRDHHEHLDGTGYPNGIAGDDITLAARVCTVVDVFDAINSARPYRDATPPMRVLQIMREGVGTKFDKEVFEAWERVVLRATKTDASALKPKGGESPQALTRFMAGAANLAEQRKGLAPGDVEKRVHERHHCRAEITARFVAQNKQYPVALMAPFKVCLADVSRGGLRIETPWPLSLGDVLRISLPMGAAGERSTVCEVVRVRKGSRGRWSAGLRLRSAGAAEGGQAA